MIITRYSIYDRMSNSYAPSFEAPNNDVAIRMVVSSLSEQSNLVLYPSDFHIVALCGFNTETGETIKYENEFVHAVAEINAIIPDKFKSFALDGSFIKE